jgi:Flp pilus assembly protein TadB
VKGPPISVHCECGADARLQYGERWQCEQCGRRYDTSTIPEGEYRQLESIVRRYRLFGYAFGALLAAFVLLLVLQDRPFVILASLPAILMVWFVYGRPLLRRRFRRAIASAPRWELRPESGPREE